MRLWARVASVVAGVSVASLLLTGFIASRVAGDTATETALAAQEREAGFVAATVRRWVEERAVTLQGWAGTFGVERLGEAKRQGLVTSVLVGVPSAVVVTLVDQDGQPIVEAAHFPEGQTPVGAVGTSADEVDALVRALPVTSAISSTSGYAVGEPFFLDGEPYLPFAFVASEDPILLLGVLLSFDLAADLRAQAGAEHAVGLVDPKGGLIVGKNQPLLRPELLRSVLGTHASVAYGVKGKEVQGAVAPVGSLGWSAVVVEPAEVAFRARTRIQSLLPLVTGGAMLLAVLLALVFSRTLTEPIARLRDVANALSEGRLGVVAEISRGDEVGELASAFDRMSVNLRTQRAEIGRQRAEIQAFNDELQQRIQEATVELRDAQESLVRTGQLAAVAQIGAGLAHELNNPLTAVLGLAQLLKMKANEDAVEDLGALEAEALRCREVVDALLRLTVDPGPIPSASASSARVLADAIGHATEAAEARGVELSVVPTEDPQIRVGLETGARTLGQLLRGLVQGMPRGATLQARIRPAQGGVWMDLDAPGDGQDKKDDWMASGVEVWLARQGLERLGVTVVEPIDSDARWQIRFERG